MFNLHKLLKKIRTKQRINKRAKKHARSLLKFHQTHPDCKIGKHCYGLPEIHHDYLHAKLTIGDYCSIAENVQIFLGGNHRTDWVSSYPFPAFFAEASHIKNYETANGNINIGSDVWLCSNVTIFSGVTIGHGAVIAYGAVVTKDVAAYSIVGGNPAKHIKWRFDETKRNALLEIAWWDWDENEVLDKVGLLCSEDIEAFIASCNYPRIHDT